MSDKIRKTPDDSDPFTLKIQSSKIRAELIKLAASAGILPDDRDDIASEAIRQAMRREREYDPTRSSVRTFLIRICENVIRSYRRKHRAEKRKAEGGVISLSAGSSEEGNDRNEPVDVGAESQRTLSVEVQHSIETAKLSRQEARAIALRLNKKDKEPTVKPSSSTDRRAMQKMKQVRADEEFHESPKGPEPLECAYGSIPAAERSAAVLFDQLRRTKWFVDAIDYWRKSAEGKNARAFLEKQADLKAFPLRILDQHLSEQLRRYRQAVYELDEDVLHRRFEAAVDITLAFPEWPAVGYCQLAPDDRRKRLHAFGWTFRAEPFWEITEPTFEVFAAAAEQDKQPSTTLAEFLDRLNKSPKTGNDACSSMHLVRIDWRYPMKTIMASFKRWAEKQPKRQSRQIPQAGRSATTLLVGFAGVRLVDDFGLSLSQAMSWLREQYGAPIPKTPERLERAVRAARDDLKHFLPSPAEIGS